ncbi:von Willebrand factor A domain-containing protein 3B isoform X4 [Dasypus novemcinctus]|uniref:von Willebrand factor A domain-containing protein 3B isoform X4 n=1 Tax=Dasypus novemcinctus TaxID=9361 RepID=UPI00265E2BD7|nr:von Willebrand factor A domain-containing protein 3B isoform X4 [Dasypus novemcinctus]
MSCDLDLNPAMEKLGSFPTAPEQQPQEPEGAGGRRDSAVQSLVSSEQWLRLHGLKSRRLTLKQILSQIGFPHQEDYVTSLGRFVASRYADGLFPQCGRAEDGSVYHVECIYYFVVGDVPDDSKELLLQKAAESPCPVCTVSFNARGDGATAFLKDLSARTHGRFHAFAQRTECVDFPAPPLKEGGGAVTWNSRKLKGTLPPGAGVREDVFLIWKEMEEACSTLAHIQKLVAEPPEADGASARCESEATTAQKEPAPEATWGSREWLQRHGLKAQKLSFYDVLADCAFRHADGVVDIKAKPEDEAVQTSAETNKKTIHAKYCSRFVHAPWKDGSLVHVGITKEKCRRYHERMHTALAQIDKRLKWLQAGSQILFGKVPKDCVYVLIDTSHSMKGILDLVKDKIIQFIQEQLRYKSKFNFVKFDAQAVAWQEKLAEIDEDSLQRAKSWVRDIETGSSTNTLQALQMAFADEETEVIYLLTDGRPDQPPEMVLDQVKVFQKIPIYTISFNYNDEIANGFLKELSCLTGGEFHSYKFGCKDSCPPENLQNEDVTLLVKEMEQGRSDLEKVQSLYSESLIMDWWYNGEKEGDSKHQKEICSLISTPESVKPPSVDESVRTSPPNPTASRWVLPSQKIQKKKVLHAEPTRTSLLRSQLSALRSSARSEGKGSPSSRSSSNPVPSDTEMSIFLTEACSDDKSLEASTQEGRQVDDRDSLATSSATWLKTHGLAARKLTIMDILSVTAVPHSSTYVPVLDKHVTSKVFDEVFPLAHVSSDTNKMTLINPHGVKLNVYKQKVEQAIKSYEKRLNKIVWRALSQEEKEKLEASKPMRYLENKAALNEALERLHWPISLKELSLLEKEILAGKLYVQQARELQEAAKKEVQQKLQVNPTKKVKSKKPDPLRGQKVIARCDENGFYFPGVVKKCLSPTHALVGFRYGDTKVVPTSFITPVGGAMPCPLLQVGDYVFAKIVIPEGFDFYVPAIVIALPSQDDEADKFYTVLKCNNRREFCPRSALIKISQNKYALSCSHIKSPPVQEDPKMQEPDAAGSPVLTRPPRDADAGAGRELRQGTPRKKQRSRRLPPQEQGFSDSDSSSLSTRSQESCPQRHPQPKAGAGRRRTSPEEPEVAVKSSARETTPQFPGQFRSQYGRTSNTSQ